MIPVGARAVFFDAVGTLLHPQIDVGIVYAHTAALYGVPDDPVEIDARFRAAFRREERIDAEAGWVTSEGRERRRWRDIVSETLPGAPAACFESLYEQFSRPGAWRAPDGAAAVLDALHARGLRLGVASNFDARLMRVLAGRPELARLTDSVVISSLVGVRKPGRGFFDALTRIADCRPEEVVLVGDDLENDYAGATAAGMTAVLLDPHDRHPDVSPRIRNLGELLSEARP